MLATAGGTLALLLGLLLLLLPLLATELSRPRDSVWGAVVLLLGLVLVTSADRLTGAPMLAVLCGGLLIGRLSSEVGLGRWRQLSDEERQLLASSARWSRSFQQLGASGKDLLAKGSDLVAKSTGVLTGLSGSLARRPQRPTSSKRWVRPELPESTEQPEPQQALVPPEPAAAPEPAAPQPPSSPPSAGSVEPGPGPDPEPPSAQQAGETPPASGSATAAANPGPVSDDPGLQVVRDFSEITALLAAAPAAEAEASEAG